MPKAKAACTSFAHKKTAVPAAKKMSRAKKPSKLRRYKKDAPRQTIKFQVDLPEWRNDGNGASPYMPLTKRNFERAVKYMRNPYEKVLKCKSATLVIDYPVRNTFTTTLTSRNGTFTRIGLVAAIADAYERMYEEERTTSTVAEQRMCDIDPSCMLINRAPTNGKWGIWGHDLKDLLLHTIIYDVDENKLYPRVDS